MQSNQLIARTSIQNDFFYQEPKKLRYLKCSARFSNIELFRTLTFRDFGLGLQKYQIKASQGSAPAKVFTD